MINKILLLYLRYFPFEAGKQRLSKYVTFPVSKNSPIVYRNSLDITFELLLSEYTMRQIYLHDIYEKTTFNTLRKLLKPNMVFFDCGANIGSYSMNMAKLLDKGFVHAFEPNTINFSRLKKNAELNKFSNVKLNNIGLSDSSGVNKIFYDSRNMGASSFSQLEGGYHKTEDVNVISIDDYCKQNNVSSIDIMKIDVEGFELKVINGALEMINKSPKMILVLEIEAEYCKREGYTAEFLFDKVVQLGFKPFLPRKWITGLKAVANIPTDISSNVIFLKGY